MPIFPVYALLFADAGLSTAQISLLFVLWSAVGIVLEVPSGAWADTVSRRGLLCLAAVVYAAAFSCWVLFPSFGGFAAGFVLWGLSGALSSGTFQALAYDELAAVGARHRYARVMGLGTTLSLAGMAFATLAAAPLIAVGGYALTGLGQRRGLPRAAGDLGVAAVRPAGDLRRRDRRRRRGRRRRPGRARARPGRRPGPGEGRARVALVVARAAHRSARDHVVAGRPRRGARQRHPARPARVRRVLRPAARAAGRLARGDPPAAHPGDGGPGRRRRGRRARVGLDQPADRRGRLGGRRAAAGGRAGRPPAWASSRSRSATGCCRRRSW